MPAKCDYPRTNASAKTPEAASETGSVAASGRWTVLREPAASGAKATVMKAPGADSTTEGATEAPGPLSAAHLAAPRSTTADLVTSAGLRTITIATSDRGASTTAVADRLSAAGPTALDARRPSVTAARETAVDRAKAPIVTNDRGA